MVVFLQVLSDLDDPSCLALGLCYAISVPQNMATPVHLSLISMLRYTTFSFAILKLDHNKSTYNPLNDIARVVLSLYMFH